MKRKMRLTIGIFIIILIAVVGYYEFRLSKFKGIEIVTCYQVREGFTITKGTELTENMFKEVDIDKAMLPKNYLKTLVGIQDKIALETMYSRDVLVSSKILERKDWDKDNDRYVALISADNFGGGDIRPLDFIDIYIFDTETKKFSLEAENIQVLSVKDKDGLDYMESRDRKFAPYKILYKSNNESFKKIIDKIANGQTKIHVTIHGNRPKLEKLPSTTIENQGIINFK